MAENRDLDAILNSALDDFEEEEEPGEQGGMSGEALAAAVDEASARADTAAQQEEQAQLAREMETLMNDLQDPAIRETLEQAFKELSAGGTDGSTLPGLLNPFMTPAATGDAVGEDGEPLPRNPAAAAAAAATAAAGGVAPGASEGTLDSSATRALQMLAEASKNMEGLSTSESEHVGEDLMARMMAEFEQMGEKEDFGGVMDSMMKQLLAKDVMYEPLRQISDAYPNWLASRRDQLSDADYERYGRQYQCVQTIVALYETEPDSHERLMELFQDMQEFGQPPAEIVRELAPGLQFDDAGQVVMPNLGSGMFPGANPGAPPGMPSFGMPGAEGEQCVIS